MSLTARQREILGFIESSEPRPTAREIGLHFNIALGAVSDHIRALRTKGYLAPGTGSSRGFTPIHSFRDHQGRLVHVPLYGSIPAGVADERHQEAGGCVSVDAQTLGVRSTASLFALRVKGDSMTGKHILHGDIAILEQRREAKTGDVVAALIDGQSTLKIYEHNGGRPFLRAANPHYPDVHPAIELIIQGILVALVRSVPL